MPTITMAKAIVRLREELGLTQLDFANQLKVSPFSISRYESGRPPSREIVRKLAALAAKAKLDSLREFFQSTRKIDIQASYKKRASAGTGRHVPLSDLQMWSARLREVTRSLVDALGATDPQLKRAAAMNAKVTADFLRSDIQLYIGEDPTRSSQGLQLDNERIKLDKHVIRAWLKDWEEREFNETKRV